MPRIRLVRPHPAQQLILDEARRWNVVALGRRAGKSTLALHLLDNWQLALRPTLTDLGGGAWFMSTPRGLNDFWSLCQQGQDPLQTEWASWQMPTSVNPFIATDELVSAQAELRSGPGPRSTAPSSC